MEQGTSLPILLKQLKSFFPPQPIMNPLRRIGNCCIRMADGFHSAISKRRICTAAITNERFCAVFHRGFPTRESRISGACSCITLLRRKHNLGESSWELTVTGAQADCRKLLGRQRHIAEVADMLQICRAVVSIGSHHDDILCMPFCRWMNLTMEAKGRLGAGAQGRSVRGATASERYGPCRTRHQPKAGMESLGQRAGSVARIELYSIRFLQRFAEQVTNS